MASSRTSRVACTILATLTLAALVVPPALAQSDDSSYRPDARATSGSDRLFLSFAEDATVIDGQWWEGQLEISQREIGPVDVDSTIARAVAAFQIAEGLELGGRVGFGSTDVDPDPFDVAGEGATDLDVWGKYHLGTFNGRTELAVGGELTVPTGDDTAGLGFDSFGIGAFFAVRHRFDVAIFTANAGGRVNEDGKLLGGDLDGRNSVFFGAGAIFPLSDHIGLVAELKYESERFRGIDDDLRILGGLNWRVTNRGMIRAAVTAGLEDGAPDTQFTAGYAFSF